MKTISNILNFAIQFLLRKSVFFFKHWLLPHYWDSFPQFQSFFLTLNFSHTFSSPNPQATKTSFLSPHEENYKSVFFFFYPSKQFNSLLSIHCLGPQLSQDFTLKQNALK